LYREGNVVAKKQKMLKITLIRSTNKFPEGQKATVVALGLTKIRQSVEKGDTPQIRGMINKVSHLLSVEEV
jgi:large subunit ribosomal protein L30